MSTRAGREAWRTLCELLFDGEAQDRMRQVSSELGLSPGLVKFLLHISPDDGVEMRELAGHWQCDASYVTNVADVLQDRGLVLRRPHPVDRRVKTMVLTDAGVAARDRALERLYEPPPSLDVLDAAEQRHLRDLLVKIAAADVELSGSRALGARHAARSR